MDLHDFLNVQKAFQTMATEWGCSIWMVKKIVQESIDQSWEKAMLDAETKAQWNKYFPKGKPTAEDYMLRLGRAYETGEQIPFLLSE